MQILKPILTMGCLGLMMWGGVSCSKEDDGIEGASNRIDFMVNSVTDLQGRSRVLIEDRGTVTALEQLTESCKGNFMNISDVNSDFTTPNKQCIRLWGTSDMAGKVTNLFNNTPLIWDSNLANEHNNKKFWNYPGPRQYWTSGAKYVFRAIYPGNEPALKISALSATTMNIQYSSQIVQQDVLVASGVKNNPVKLDFSHILSALKFKFKYKPKVVGGVIAEDGIDNLKDFITESWLENTASDDVMAQKIGCFATVGSMTYGQGNVGATDENRELKYWRADLCERAMYHWKSGDANGIEFSNTTPASGDTQCKVAVAYTGTTHPQDGKLFTENDGWVLTIPQYIFKNVVVLCFKTKLNGDHVYRVVLNRPWTSASDPQRAKLTYMGRDYEALDLKKAMRYTFTVIFRATDVAVDVDIKPWNKVDISDEIIF